MWQLLKNAKIYAPEKLDHTDVLIVGRTIAMLGKELTLPEYLEGITLDLDGQILVPGFIDGHVHICGGGGEAGPTSRTPEIQLSQITRAGITTVVGCLGTDAVSRSMEELLIKAIGLEQEGITTYIYSGAYQATRTIFRDLRKDLVLIEKIVGAGEIAISDHRSAQIQITELEHLAAQVRVGGMLSGKAGVIHLHLGEGKRGLGPVWSVLQNTEIPIAQFYPTHMNRTYSLLEEGVRFLQAGGNIDFTAGCDDFPLDLQVPKVLHTLAERELLNGRGITVTSDGNGSLPQYNEDGQLVQMGIGQVSVLWRDVREAVLKYGLPLESVLPVITSNPARILLLKNKGSIKIGNDADLVCLDDKLEIRHVWAKGVWMVKERHPLAFGTYERTEHII